LQNNTHQKDHAKIKKIACGVNRQVLYRKVAINTENPNSNLKLNPNPKKNKQFFLGGGIFW